MLPMPSMRCGFAKSRPAKQAVSVPVSAMACSSSCPILKQHFCRSCELLSVPSCLDADSQVLRLNLVLESQHVVASYICCEAHRKTGQVRFSASLFSSRSRQFIQHRSSAVRMSFLLEASVAWTQFKKSFWRSSAVSCCAEADAEFSYCGIMSRELSLKNILSFNLSAQPAHATSQK